MRAIIQRVSSAHVDIDGKTVGSCGYGLMILLGVGHEDTEDQADRLWAKISKLRIFADDEGKTNLSLRDIDGSVLIVSQFTLYADCRRGNRPSFTGAGEPVESKRLYEYVVSLAEETLGKEKVGHGEFGADMQVGLVNDGPFTLTLEIE